MSPQRRLDPQGPGALRGVRRAGRRLLRARPPPPPEADPRAGPEAEGRHHGRGEPGPRARRLFGVRATTASTSSPCSTWRRTRSARAREEASRCGTCATCATLVSAEQIDIAVVAVPGEAAQQVVAIIVQAGIRAILNFAPSAIRVPEGVKIKNVDLSVSLETLSFFLAQGAHAADDVNPVLTHVAPDGRVTMVDVGAKAVTRREAVARGRIVDVRGGTPCHPFRCREEGRSSAGRPTRRHHGGQADRRPDSTLSPAGPDARVGRPEGDADGLRDQRSRAIRRPDRRRDGGVDGGRRGGARPSTTCSRRSTATMVISDIRLLEKRGGKSGEYVRSD